MNSEETILEYTGHLTFSTTGRLLTMLKSKLGKKGLNSRFYKPILSVMIEVLENVYKNSDQYLHDLYVCEKYIPHFKLTTHNNSYFIYCSNPIRNEKVEALEKKLELVNSLSVEELRLLYRQTIANGQFTNKGGAGLGIIEMAKISGNPIHFSFEKINSNFSFYSIKILFD